MNVKQDFSTPGTHFPVLICEIPLFNILLVIQEFVLALYFVERFLTFLKHCGLLYLSVTSDSSLSISQTLHARSTVTCPFKLFHYGWVATKSKRSTSL
jgi:hypothetical protein